MFMTNRISLMLLKFSYTLYKIERTAENKIMLTTAIKMNLYNLIIDMSFILCILLLLTYYYLPYLTDNIIYINLIILSIGLYFINIINRLVIELYLNKKDAYYRAEEYAKKILKEAPEFILFNEKEKEIMYTAYIKKMKNMI